MVAYSIPARCPREGTVSPLTRAIAHPLPQQGRGTRWTPARSQLLVFWPANPQRYQPHAVPSSAAQQPLIGIRLSVRVCQCDCNMDCCFTSGSPSPGPTLRPPLPQSFGSDWNHQTGCNGVVKTGNQSGAAPLFGNCWDWSGPRYDRGRVGVRLKRCGRCWLALAVSL